MNRLTWHERLLIVAVVLLILTGAIARYYRALRDHPDAVRGERTPPLSKHAEGLRTD